jgi:DNA-binding NtrC family response regulator
MKVSPRPISAEALAKLKAYAFPGNIRELRNLLERALILGQHAELQPEDFHIEATAQVVRKPEGELTIEQLASMLPTRLDLKEAVARFERSLLERALALTNGVQAEAARHLEISRSDFGYKAAKYALTGAPRSNSN